MCQNRRSLRGLGRSRHGPARRKGRARWHRGVSHHWDEGYGQPPLAVKMVVLREVLDRPLVCPGVSLVGARSQGACYLRPPLTELTACSLIP